MYDDKEIEVKVKAKVIIAAVENELASGTKHFRKSDNKPLETVLEILRAIKDEGGVIFEPKKEEVV